MPKFVFANHGGGEMADDPDEMAALEQRWRARFGSLGDAVVDGGAPFSTSAKVEPGGAVSDGSGKNLTGYSVVQAADLATASEHATDCPVLEDGGTVDVYECIDVG